jgi:hypothetical protein
MKFDPDSYLNYVDRPAADDGDSDDRIARRQTRRLARVVALDRTTAELQARLDSIGRQAPLPHATVAAVNALIGAARRPLARLSGASRPAPFRFDRVTLPADAVAALFRLREALAAAGEAMIDASLRDSPLADKF